LLLACRRFGSLATASLLIAGALTAAATSAARAQAQAPASVCNDANDIAVLPAPLAPWKGAPLRVLFAVEKPLDGTLSLVAPDGSVAANSGDRMGGPPYFWYAEVAAPAAGTWHATLTPKGASGCAPITRDIAVRDAQLRPQAASGGAWPLRNSWNRATENLYSAWIEKMFDAPLDAEPSWKALTDVLRDRSRNMLFDYLGLREDDNLLLRPDCAKLPYLLRAYFASKMGLPFGYSHCTRGNLGKPPKCYGWFNTEHPEASRPSPPQPEPISASVPQESKPPAGLLQQMFSGPAAAPAPADEPAESPTPAPKRLGRGGSFAEYLQTVSDAVQSGNGRTLAADNNTDFYPVALSQTALRPGTIYADPYGHIMMLVRRVAQTADAAGMFLAVDAEPDYTVARKRFWRGSFLFVNDPALGNPGFKRFRPIVREANGTLRRLTNAEIAKSPQYGDFSLEQSKLGVEDFYDRMDDVASPEPLDPARAMKEAIDSLEEQVKTRVGSVDFGRKFLDKTAADATMPDGPAIFQTSGAWEDFATPARDFRLLIAIDVVRNFPDHVARRPDRYAIPAGKSIADVKAQLQSVLATELASRKFSYTRSDGSSWTLTLKDVVDRAPAYEMGYNLNDCVELRWGAPENSQEASTCKRHAPAAQRTKMIKYRAWFHDRHWPARA
jgi:hypothetical protein